jgi:BirA family biotin operon repressor/biotin-[acetyl-CoA-carboxylase] ligase
MAAVSDEEMARAEGIMTARRPHSERDLPVWRLRGQTPPRPEVAAEDAAWFAREIEPRLPAYAAFAARLDRWERRWREGGFPAIRGEWLGRATGVGAELRVRLDKESFTGRFLDLDDDGALLVETENGRRRIGAGDVFPAT